MFRKNILISLALGLASFLVYVFTMPPSVYIGDSGEIATAVYVWGIAHPTGFPAYLILAKLFSYLLPWLEFGHRLNIFSALIGAATVGIVFLILQSSLLSKEGKREAWPPIAASLSLAFGFTFWSHAATIQVYGLTAFFFALAILIFLYWVEVKKSFYFYLLALICGIGAGTHLTFLLFFPFALVFFALKLRRKEIKIRLKDLFFCFLVFLLFCFLVYSYIPLRAKMSPALNWGDPSNAENFIHYITQGDYADKIGSRSFESWSLMIKEIGKMFSREFTWLGLVLVIAGAAITFKKQRIFFYAGLSVIILNIILMGNYGNEQDIIILWRYFLPSYIIMAVFIAAGLQSIFSPFVKGGFPPEADAPLAQRGILFLILPAIIFAAHFGDLNRRDYKLLQNTAQHILESVPQNTILITSGDSLGGVFMYNEATGNTRPDLVIIDDKLYTHPWYLAKKKTELESKNFVYNSNLSYLVKENLDKGIYSVSNAISFLKINFDFLPNGITYKLVKKGGDINYSEVIAANRAVWQNYNFSFLANRVLDKEPLNKEIADFYIAGLNNFGAFLVNRGDMKFVEEGIGYFKKSLDVRENKNALYNLAGIYNALGDNFAAMGYKARFDALK
jgi:hypothetical protein